MSRVHAIVAAVLMLTAADAFARNLAVPGRFRSIDAASKKAKPGDRIVVRGRLRKDQTLTASDVSLDLQRARLDGSLTILGDRSSVVGGDLRGLLHVVGMNASVRDTRVGGSWKNTTIGDGWIRKSSVLLDGAYARIDSVVIKATAGSAAIRSTADQLVLDDCRVLNGDVEVNGAHNILINNACLDGCIVCSGDGPRVFANVVHAAGVDGITVASDHASVSHNEVTGSDGAGIVSSGVGSSIERNVVTHDLGSGAFSPAAITVTGGSGSVSNNTVTRTDASDADGISVVGGECMSVANNVVSGPLDAHRGVFVDGIDIRVYGNDVAGGGDGIVVCGRLIRIDANTVHDVGGDGIVVASEQSSVTDPDVQGAGGAGVVLFNPADVVGGSVVGSGIAGIVIFQEGCSLSGCALSGNQIADVITTGATSTSNLGPDVTVVSDPMQFPQLVDRWQTRPLVVVNTAQWIYGND